MSDSDTTAAIPPAARRVQDAARKLGLDVTAREMAESTRTAEDAAAACGVTVGQIVKSLVFVGAQSGRPYLLLVSGSNRVNEAGVAAHLGEALKRLDGRSVRDMTGFAIGGIPPFGHDRPLRTYMDMDLLQYDVVWAAAGTPRSVFAVHPERLRDAVKAEVITVV
jgi:prolyl-tRNA editing enzyme YbaK/EbsC (Cys-tRNA(Pro) deacylase)